MKTKNKKANLLFLVVLLSFLVVGFFLLTFGFIKAYNLKTNSVNGRKEEDIKLEINKLESEISQLNEEIEDEFETNGFSDRYYELQNKAISPVEEENQLQDELKLVGDNSWKAIIKSVKVLPFIIYGGVIIILGVISSLSIVIIYNKKNKNNNLSET